MHPIPPSISTHRTEERSGSRKSFAYVAFIATVAAPALLLMVLQRSEHSPALHAGDSIPTGELGKADQGRAVLAATNGKSAALLFFSTNCPHCKWEIPVVNDAMKRFGEQVEFAAIALNDTAHVQMFMRTNDVRMHVIIDEFRNVAGIFGVEEVPTLVLLNQDRTIAWIGSGEQSKGEVFRRLASLLKSNSIP
jgi:thiol-disulfide isomerase/thioredoxin